MEAVQSDLLTGSQFKLKINLFQNMQDSKEDPIAKFSQEAQAPYLTQSMKDLGSRYQGPPKYLKQRDAPLEIPHDCIRKLADAIDTSMDERCDLHEIIYFVKKHEIPISEEICTQMFHEAASGRGYVTDKQMSGPLTQKEIAAAVRGRHAWNTETKEWEVKYRPFRDYWIVLLLKVNPKIFALQVPKIIPDKIRAQYELEAEAQ